MATTQSQEATSQELTSLVTSTPLVVVPEDKAATLQALTTMFQLKFGKHVFFQGGQTPEIIFRTTGISALDEILEGGLPAGRLIELWGDDENGKLSLLYTMMKQYGPHVLYVDADRAANKKLMDRLGVDPNIIVMQPETLEYGLEAIIEFANKGCPFIVIDSLPAMLPAKERAEKDFLAQAGVSMTANLLTRKIYDLVAKASNSGAIVVLTNQLRDKVGNKAMFGEQYKAPGGHALKHACSVVLKMAKVKYLTMEINKTKVTYGQETAIQVYQSKVSTPNQDTSLFLVYNHGFFDMFQIGEARKVFAEEIKKKTVVVTEEKGENDEQ